MNTTMQRIRLRGFSVEQLRLVITGCREVLASPGAEHVAAKSACVAAMARVILRQRAA